jgi:hypothetical protein
MDHPIHKIWTIPSHTPWSINQTHAKSGRKDAWGGHLQLWISDSWDHVEKEKTVKMEETNEDHVWREKTKRNSIALLGRIYSSKIYLVL